MSQFKFQKDNVDVSDLVLAAADFANGGWHSDEVTTQNVDRVTAMVEYKELTPDGKDNNVQYRLQAVLEGKEADGSWTPLVKQQNGLSSSENALKRKLVCSSTPMSYDPDSEHIIPNAIGQEDVAVSFEQADVPDKVRLCITLAEISYDPPLASLTSVKLTLNGQMV